MGNNEIMAIANAREIEKLPYETLKTMFLASAIWCKGKSGIGSS